MDEFVTLMVRGGSFHVLGYCSRVGEEKVCLDSVHLCLPWRPMERALINAGEILKSMERLLSLYNLRPPEYCEDQPEMRRITYHPEEEGIGVSLDLSSNEISIPWLYEPLERILRSLGEKGSVEKTLLD